MTIETREVEHRHKQDVLKGVLAFDKDSPESRPAVLIFHGIEGRSEIQVEFASKLVAWGYAGFAVDLFGDSVAETGVDRGRERVSSFMQDRMGLHHRLLDVFELVRSLPEVDARRIAAIGFCFGGLCVLDLARIGADVRGVASFHGLLTPPDDLPATRIKTKVIVFHGWEDPFAPPEALVALGRELSTSDADWQVHAYGKAMHAFMAPWANDPAAGILYNEAAARRSWSALKEFLAEALA